MSIRTLGWTLFTGPKSNRLMEAVASGDNGAVASLLRSGERPNKTIHREDGSTTTPFFEAIKTKNEAMIGLFLSEGANPNQVIAASYATSTTPLSYLIGRQNSGEEISPHLLEQLLRAGADPLKAFKLLDTDRSRQFTDLFWRYRADVNREIRETDGSTSTPLLEAIKNKDKKLVALLLKEGASPNTPRFDKGTNSLASPLYDALKQNDLELVDMLLKAGADPSNGHIAIEFGCNFTETPLYVAIQYENPAMVELLLKTGAKPNEIARKQEPETPDPIKLTFDETPLYQAITGDKEEIINLLLRYGADPNQKSRTSSTHFDTPLYQAVWRGKPESWIRSLLAAGADPLQPAGRSLSTPIDLAIEMDKRTLIALLLTRAKPSKINVTGLVDKAKATSPQWVNLRTKNSQYSDFDDILTIPHDKVTIKTRWVGSLHGIAKECVDAVYAASNPFVTPIVGYLDKGIKEKQPRVLRFLPENSGISELGFFDPKSKDIIIRVFDKGNIDASIKKGFISADAFFPTYVHENYHAMLEATGLHHDMDFFKRVKLAAEADILTLKKKNWASCDRLIKSNLVTAEAAYSSDQHLEEYLVRIPQMIVELQQRDKCTWQAATALVKEAIPTLYKLVEDEVLARFNEWAK